MNATPEEPEAMSITTFRSTPIQSTDTAQAPLPAHDGRTQLDATAINAAREHIEAKSFDTNLDRLIDALPDAVEAALRQTRSHCTPELITQFTETMATVLREDAAENATYLPELISECERVGLALQLTDDPEIDLSEIQVINGRRTVITRADQLGVTLDDVRTIGRCLTCRSELDGTAIPYLPANGLLGYCNVMQDMTGADVKICRPCFEASGLPLTAAQRGTEWMARYDCTPWCISDHAAPVFDELHKAFPVETKLRDADLDPNGNSGKLPWLSAQVIVSNDKAQAYGRETSVCLAYGVHLAEISPAKAREALDAMRGFVTQLERVVKDAEKVAADDFAGDPEIARLDREADDRKRAARHALLEAKADALLAEARANTAA